MTSGSKDQLKLLIKQEIKEIAAKLKDPRCSDLKIRSAARVLDSNLLTKSADLEVTVVLSDKGWVRCGKGHDIDHIGLNYKSGEQYKSHATGLANQNAIFLDSTGKSYSLLASSLPSMRGYGEPLTSKLSPESGAVFESVIMGDLEQKVLLSQSKGFGFITTIDNLQAKTKSGKNIINLNGGRLLHPVNLTATSKYCVLLTSDLKMLAFDVGLIPELNKGRGGKLCAVGNKNSVIAISVLNDQDDLTINYGEKQLIVRHKEVLNYVGNLGDVGYKFNKLPKEASKHNIDLS